MALTESLFGPLGETVGATVALECPGRVDALLFSEGASRILLSVNPPDADELESLAEKHGVALSRLGITGGDRLRIQINGVDAISIELSDLREAWWSSIEREMRP